MKKEIEVKLEKEIRYTGYFLIDSGYKVNFDISKEDGGDEFAELYNNMIFSFKTGGCIWLGEDSSLKLIVDRVIGWDINEYEV